MTTEQALPFSLSVVEDVLQEQGSRLSDIDLASRKAEQASLRRYEAAGWLRKTVGVVGGKDLPAEPSEEEFRLGLRSGIILCNVLNKVLPGSVAKVVEGPCDSVIIPDGAALSAFQYFENVRNFLVAAEEMGLPTFEASDLEQGGKSSRVVNCVLALKSYSDWKKGGGNGSWKYAPNLKPSNSGTGKHFLRKNAEPFMNSFAKVLSVGEKSVDGASSEHSDISEADSTNSLAMLVRAALSDKRQEEIPWIVESMLSKVMEEFGRRLASQSIEPTKRTSRDVEESEPKTSPPRTASCDDKVEVETPAEERTKDEPPMQVETTVEERTKDEPMQVETTVEERTEDEPPMQVEKTSMQIEEMECHNQKDSCDEESKQQNLIQQMLVEQQQRNIQELKHTLHATKEGMQFLQMKYREEFSNLGKQLHRLAHAASGYQKLLMENLKLYNQIQDLKGNIRVYCRVRPFLGGQPNRMNAVDNIDDGSITIITPSKYGKEGRKTFNFNKVFGPTATQADVFSDTQPLIRSVLDGYNVCIFAYGQTGSGKTYTMTGPTELTEEGLGVNYRALSDLFLLSKQRKETICYEIAVQMLEIYNEQVRDLLTTDGTNKKLEIRNSSQNGINVPDANLVPVSSTSDVINLMNLGHKNRAVSATAMNDRSSRSHSCLTVHVQGRDLTTGTTLRGSMHLVDLAGSERVDKSEVTGDRLKEAQHINKSLAALGDVISSLANKNTHVPYRNSKLTQLLQDALGGQAKTLMFVHISPESEALSETLSTLKFAERVATIELGAAKLNKDSGDVKELKEQIASLKAALARKEREPAVGQRSQSTSPERSRANRRLSSSPKCMGLGGMSGSRMQAIEDVSTENDLSSSRRQSFDLHDLMATSPSWPPISSVSSAKEDDRESRCGDWVDKVMVNKHDSLGRNDDSTANWEVDRQPPEKLYQSCTPDPSKIYPEQALSKLSPKKKDHNQDCDAQRTRFEVASTDDSDHDAATSDCSETDSLWQVNIPKVTITHSGLGPRAKKTQPKTAKSTEPRSLIPSLIPSAPTRKTPNGIHSQLHKPGRHQTAVDGKRKTGFAK